jgi:hypothetical protein
MVDAGSTRDQSLPSPRFRASRAGTSTGAKAGITDDWFTVAALVAAGH